MRKDLWVKLAGLAIMLTLISSSLVSGTYAKYVKEVTGSDTVRVAKFAFNLKNAAALPEADPLATQASETAAFDIFNFVDTGVYANGVNGTRFIAPGTTGSFGLTVENLSEVDVVASFGAAETNEGLIPVYYTIGAAAQRYSSVLTGSYGAGEGAGTYGNMGAFGTAMAGVVGTLEATDGTAATSSTVTINWTWAFDSAGTGQSDTLDTNLGIGGSATVKLAVTVAVTQTD